MMQEALLASAHLGWKEVGLQQLVHGLDDCNALHLVSLVHRLIEGLPESLHQPLPLLPASCTHTAILSIIAAWYWLIVHDACCKPEDRALTTEGMGQPGCLVHIDNGCYKHFQAHVYSAYVSSAHVASADVR